MFHLVNYVDQRNELSKEDKYRYVKMLRTQLSTQEQQILFLNALSDLGKRWEKDGLVSRYLLVKNLPITGVANVDPRKYFDIQYEFMESIQ